MKTESKQQFQEKLFLIFTSEPRKKERKTANEEQWIANLEFARKIVCSCYLHRPLGKWKGLNGKFTNRGKTDRSGLRVRKSGILFFPSLALEASILDPNYRISAILRCFFQPKLVSEVQYTNWLQNSLIKEHLETSRVQKLALPYRYIALRSKVAS